VGNYEEGNPGPRRKWRGVNLEKKKHGLRREKEIPPNRERRSRRARMMVQNIKLTW